MFFWLFVFRFPEQLQLWPGRNFPLMLHTCANSPPPTPAIYSTNLVSASYYLLRTLAVRVSRYGRDIVGLTTLAYGLWKPCNAASLGEARVFLWI